MFNMNTPLHCVFTTYNQQLISQPLCYKQVENKNVDTTAPVCPPSLPYLVPFLFDSVICTPLLYSLDPTINCQLLSHPSRHLSIQAVFPLYSSSLHEILQPKISIVHFSLVHRDPPAVFFKLRFQSPVSPI